MSESDAIGVALTEATGELGALWSDYDTSSRGGAHRCDLGSQSNRQVNRWGWRDGESVGERTGSTNLTHLEPL